MDYILLYDAQGMTGGFSTYIIINTSSSTPIILKFFTIYLLILDLPPLRAFLSHQVTQSVSVRHYINAIVSVYSINSHSQKIQAN